MRGLYIHIPFCKSICSYCDFTKRVSSDELKDRYTKRLLEEIEYYKEYIPKCDTVYLGGGTPNSLMLESLDEILSSIAPALNNSIESTIELNPELVTDKLCALLKKHKISRVSLGVETIDEKELKLLNRHHTKDDIINSVKLLRKYDINNISCDLMFGLPYETMDMLKTDLDFILSLKPNHISCYSLIIEEKTVLSLKVEKKELELPSDDLTADMYDYINLELARNGFIHYETSNYAKPGYESKHNTIYWTMDEYLGLGSGASGFINGHRYDNNRSLFAYFEAFKENDECLSIDTLKSEFMMLGLRLTRGISISRYKELYNSSPFDDFDLKKLIDRGLLVVDNDNIKIPSDKLFLANMVWEEFV